ncbi:MAG: hypothetical protein D6741_02310 [Planctomycetota bacterium]|nr:MAG: hypothetical protein D6741_02310 [Planctomycetota bacterium]
MTTNRNPQARQSIEKRRTDQLKRAAKQPLRRPQDVLRFQVPIVVAACGMTTVPSRSPITA